MGPPQDLNWISSRITIYLPEYYSLLLSFQALQSDGLQMDEAGEKQRVVSSGHIVTCVVLSYAPALSMRMARAMSMRMGGLFCCCCHRAAQHP
jgi:hypothetical protein